MGEIFFPTGSKPMQGARRGFLPAQSYSNLDEVVQTRSSRVSNDRLKPGEERLLQEVREMQRQVQKSMAEEIKSQSRHLLHEFKRELRTAMDSVKCTQPQSLLGADLLAHTDADKTGRVMAMLAKAGDPTLHKAVTGDLSPHTPNKSSSLGGKGKSSRAAAEKASEGTVPSPARATFEPQSPLAAHGDAPPLLPFQVEAPPMPPIIDAEEDVPHKALRDQPLTSTEDNTTVTPASKKRVSLADVPEEISDDSSLHEGCSEYSNDTFDNIAPSAVLTKSASQRRLSLGVDACRRSRKVRVTDARPLWKLTAAEFLNSTKFDNMVGSLILLNAITIGIQTDYAAKNVTENFPDVFQIIERIFLACFAVELALRIYVHRRNFFCDCKNAAWNYFDTAVVSAQIFEEALMLIAANVQLNTGMFTILRILRILRIVRILRVVRVLHLISELRTIVSSIIGSLRSLVWTVVLLLLVIYIVGVYFTQTITDHLVEIRTNTNGTAAYTQKDSDLAYFFGSLSRTILSLWQSMSGGADWDMMAAPLIDQVGVFTGLAFAVFIAFALLALMNVVTGVFVQTALQSAKDEEDTFLVDQVLKLFNKSAAADSETITIDQIDEKFADPNTQREWRAINVQPTEAKYLFGLLDIEETGEVSFQEFLSGCLRLHGASKSMDVLTVMQENRSMSRQLLRTFKRWEEYNRNFQTMLERVANTVAATSNILANLSLSIDQSTDASSQNADKIGRLEKRIRSFEGSLCSVRVAASNMNKVNEIIDCVMTKGSGNRGASDNSDPSGAGASPDLGPLCTIDEV